MSDVFEHNPGDHEDPTAGPTSMVGVVGAIVLTACILLLTALYYNVKATQFKASVLEEPRLDVLDLTRQQEQLLAGPPRWVERDEGGQKVRAYVIPIELAMQRVVEESGAKRKP